MPSAAPPESAPMSDLVDRLNFFADAIDRKSAAACLCREAANEIERMRDRLALLMSKRPDQS